MVEMEMFRLVGKVATYLPTYLRYRFLMWLTHVVSLDRLETFGSIWNGS